MSRFAQALTLALVTLAACVGEDPDLKPQRPDGGVDAGDDASESDAGPPRKAFVTSAVYVGDFGGYAAADKACNDLARAANVSGTFKAWLSIGTTSAASRIGFRGGYERVDGKTIATNRKALVGGSLGAPLDVTEKNEKLASGNVTVWTNTSASGDVAQAGYDCQGFTSKLPATGPASSPGGSATATDAAWTASSGAINCANEARFYCFED
jgi:hypothetical protein